ncbi:hypothetical protein PR048_030854 [Dryococelus australis]|uniref:Uncharacterized protein n=1 Tax=Dryococelus australis TaxID=614101 RepID=A0ABQ9GAT8_9NEOP|nr:hypothetical protein PR048_030854 [Dryococelus australis]
MYVKGLIVIGSLMKQTNGQESNEDCKYADRILKYSLNVNIFARNRWAERCAIQRDDVLQGRLGGAGGGVEPSGASALGREVKACQWESPPAAEVNCWLAAVMVVGEDDLGEGDKLYFKHTYISFVFTIVSQFIRHAQLNSEPITDLQGNKRRIQRHLVRGKTGYTCLLEKAFLNLTEPLRIRTHRHCSYVIRVQTVNTCQEVSWFEMLFSYDARSPFIVMMGFLTTQRHIHEAVEPVALPFVNAQISALFEYPSFCLKLGKTMVRTTSSAAAVDQWIENQNVVRGGSVDITTIKCGRGDSVSRAPINGPAVAQCLEQISSEAAVIQCLVQQISGAAVAQRLEHPKVGPRRLSGKSNSLVGPRKPPLDCSSWQSVGFDAWRHSRHFPRGTSRLADNNIAWLWVFRDEVQLRPDETFFVSTSGRFMRSRLAGAGETGDPRENTPTRGIVRHDSHMLKSESNPVGNRTRFALVGGESSNHFSRRGNRCHGGRAVSLLTSRQGQLGSIPSRVVFRFSQVGIVSEVAADKGVFSGVSRFSPPCILTGGVCCGGQLLLLQESWKELFLLHLAQWSIPWDLSALFGCSKARDRLPQDDVTNYEIKTIQVTRHCTHSIKASYEFVRSSSGEVWVAVNNEIARADEGETRNPADQQHRPARFPLNKHPRVTPPGSNVALLGARRRGGGGVDALAATVTTTSHEKHFAPTFFMQEIMGRFRQLSPDGSECGCMKAVILFTPVALSNVDTALAANEDKRQLMCVYSMQIYCVFRSIHEKSVAPPIGCSRANPLHLQGKEIMQGGHASQQRGIRRPWPAIGAITTSLDVLIVKTITKKRLGKTASDNRSPRFPLFVLHPAPRVTTNVSRLVATAAVLQVRRALVRPSRRDRITVSNGLDKQEVWLSCWPRKHDITKADKIYQCSVRQERAPRTIDTSRWGGVPLYSEVWIMVHIQTRFWRLSASRQNRDSLPITTRHHSATAMLPIPDRRSHLLCDAQVIMADVRDAGMIDPALIAAWIWYWWTQMYPQLPRHVPEWCTATPVSRSETNLPAAKVNPSLLNKCVFLPVPTAPNTDTQCTQNVSSGEQCTLVTLLPRPYSVSCSYE